MKRLNQLGKYLDFTKFQVGQRVAVCQYGSSYSIGTVRKIEDNTDGIKSMMVEQDSHFDAYKRSNGIVESKCELTLTECYYRPVLTEEQFKQSEGL